MTEEAIGIDLQEAARREAVMQDFADRINADDIEEVLRSIAAHCYADVEWIEDPSWPGSSSLRGIGDVLELARERALRETRIEER